VTNNFPCKQGNRFKDVIQHTEPYPLLSKSFTVENPMDMTRYERKHESHVTGKY